MTPATGMVEAGRSVILELTLKDGAGAAAASPE